MIVISTQRGEPLSVNPPGQACLPPTRHHGPENRGRFSGEANGSWRNIHGLFRLKTKLQAFKTENKMISGYFSTSLKRKRKKKPGELGWMLPEEIYLFKSEKLRDPKSKIDFRLPVYSDPAFFLLPTSDLLPNAAELFPSRAPSPQPRVPRRLTAAIYIPQQDLNHHTHPSRGSLGFYLPPDPRRSFPECRSEHVPLTLKTCPRSWFVCVSTDSTRSLCASWICLLLPSLQFREGCTVFSPFHRWGG